MSETSELDFSVVDQAAIRNTELATLLNVSRPTVIDWRAGRASPHRLHIDKISDFLDTLRRAVKAGKLPLDSTILQRERMHVLKRVLRQYAE